MLVGDPMYLRLAYLIVLPTIFVLSSACMEGKPQIRCDPDSPEPCPPDWICKPVVCPDDYRCSPKRPEDRDYYAGQCVVDGFCDVETCETRLSCIDCYTDCGIAAATGPPQEYLVSSYQTPTTPQEAGETGVDLDGDGDIDNKYGNVVQFLGQFFPADLNAEIAAEIAAGPLLIAVRVHPAEPAEAGTRSVVQLLLAEVQDATPLYDGQDEVRLAANASVEDGMCGNDSEQTYGSRFSSATMRLPLSWPGPGGTVLANLHPVRIAGDISPTGWQEVHLGGGLSPAYLYDVLLPLLAGIMTRTIADDPLASTSDKMADLFDGNCIQLEDIPGCESVIYGEGECDDDAAVPVITATELRCNALIQSVLKPDVDIDGDGVADVLSYGVRLSAVPVTIRAN